MADSLQATGTLSACCKTIIQQVNSLNSPDKFNTNNTNRFLAALNSPQNLAGVDPALITAMESQYGKRSLNGNGGNCAFKVWLTKPNCDTVTTTRKLLCDNSNTNTPEERRIEYDLSVNEIVSDEGYLTPAQYQCLCNGTRDEVLQRAITDSMQAMLKKANNNAIAKAMLAAGKYTNGQESLTNTKQLNLFNDVNGNFQVQQMGFAPMLLEYDTMQVNGGVLAVGGYQAFQYQVASKLTRQFAGEVATPDGISIWYDPEMQNQASGTAPQPLLTWAPGAIALIRYLDNANGMRIGGANVERAVLTYQGFDFDFSLSIDAACEKIRWVLNGEWDLWMVPAAAWGDCLVTNQKQLYTIGCLPYDCDQILPPQATPPIS